METKFNEVSLVRAYHALKPDYKIYDVINLFNADIRKASIEHLVQKMNKITVMAYAANYGID